ncbi:hypothetical protein LCGC14_2533650 [marine sediment metagenome]|uniref:Uncharacterized protein n=1 Tax=marine sediment metagenome TaxID=412755 RepID=A0A0F9DKV7_9ZZZZ
MNWILLILAVALISWLILGGIFFAYPTVQRLKSRRDEFGWIIKVPIYLWFVLGYLSDVGFNLTWGTFIFRELPRELIFTDRLQRHWTGTNEKQKRRAQPWARRLNAIDPGHV